MIRRVRLANFKRFRDQTFELDAATVLAGPNNSGKSTLMQAMTLWKDALDLWVAQRHEAPRAAKRTGVGINGLSCNAVPVRDLNLLWNDRVVSGGNGPGATRLLEVAVEGESHGKSWTCALEFQYAHHELAYVRPLGAKDMASQELDAFPPLAAKELQVVRAPALSGVRRDEPLHAPGMQSLIVGENRTGDMLRNLLWEIGGPLNPDRSAWESLIGHLRELFQIDLLPPAYSAAEPYIRSEYREAGRDKPLDLSSAGSGTLQVMMLLAFLHRRPGTVLLLDEPDAHQHVILQRDVYALLRKIAHERDGQVIDHRHAFPHHTRGDRAGADPLLCGHVAARLGRRSCAGRGMRSRTTCCPPPPSPGWWILPKAPRMWSGNSGRECCPARSSSGTRSTSSGSRAAPRWAPGRDRSSADDFHEFRQDLDASFVVRRR